MRIRWTPDRLRRAADLSAEGLGATEIAATLGVSKDAAASAMSRYGLFATSRRSYRRQPETTTDGPTP